MPALAPASSRVAAPHPARLDSRGPTRARRACLARPKARARSSDDGGADVADRVLDVWAGGGTGIVAPSDASALERLETRWRACAAMDLESRWVVTKDLWLVERERAGLSADWKLGWSGAKTYVGITYMWGEAGEEKGEIFLSKYLLLDPVFENVLGCMRHELAHALVGPEEDHGPRWRSAAEALCTPRNWSSGHGAKLLRATERRSAVDRAGRRLVRRPRVQTAARAVREDRVAGGRDEDGVHGRRRERGDVTFRREGVRVIDRLV
jgi:hypothetical protein